MQEVSSLMIVVSSQDDIRDMENGAWFVLSSIILL
jgi:hypothetical protein